MTDSVAMSYVTGARFFELLKLGVPLTISFMAEIAMMWTDVWVVSKLGVDSLASMSLASSYMIILFVSGIGFAIVVNPIASKKIGAGEETLAVEYIAATVWLTAIVGVLLGVVVAVGPEVLLLIGQEEELVDIGRIYLYFIAPSMPFALATIALRGFFSSANCSFYFGVIFCLGVLLNLVLDLVLVLGWGDFEGLGILGAALASLTVNIMVFVGVLLVGFLYRPLARYRLIDWIYRVPRLSIVKDIFLLGLPISISFLVEEVFFMGSTFFVGLLGSEALAIHQVIVIIGFLGIALAVGFGEAARSQMGWYFGKRDFHSFIGAMLTFVIVITVMMVCASVFLRYFSDNLADQFLSEGVSLEIRENFIRTAHLWSWFILAEIPIGVFVSILYVVGDTRTKMLADLLIYWIIAMPMIGWLVMNDRIGVYGVWMILGVAMVTVSVFIGVIAVRRLIIVKRDLGS